MIFSQTQSQSCVCFCFISILHTSKCCILTGRVCSPLVSLRLCNKPGLSLYLFILNQAVWLWVAKVTVTPWGSAVSGDHIPLTNTLQDSCPLGTLPAEWWGSNFYLHCLADSVAFPSVVFRLWVLIRTDDSEFFRGVKGAQVEIFKVMEKENEPIIFC